jgi:hypothetical protein
MEEIIVTPQIRSVKTALVNDLDVLPLAWGLIEMRIQKREA